MYVLVEIKGGILIHLKDLRFQMIGKLTNTYKERALKLYILFTALYQPFIWIGQAEDED